MDRHDEHRHDGVDPGARSDEALVRAARTGEVVAFDALVERHGPGMLRFAMRMVGDDTDARDVVQEAFVSAWKNLSTFESRSALRTWLFRLVHRRAVDLQRRRKPTPVDDEVLSILVPPTADDPLQHVLDAELLEALQVALGDLSESARAVWLLREIEQMSYGEIADTLVMSADSVRGHLHRARGALAERMDAWR